MAVKMKSVELETRLWRLLVTLARKEGKTPEVKLREIVENTLQPAQAHRRQSDGEAPAVEYVHQGLTFNSLADSDTIDWSDDPGPDPALYRLQAETVGIVD